MSQVNARQKRAIENLAQALNECFDAATERAAEKAADRAAEKAADRAAKKAAESIKADLNDTLARQNDTLRMIWTQCGGKKSQRLPIDG